MSEIAADCMSMKIKYIHKGELLRRANFKRAIPFHRITLKPNGNLNKPTAIKTAPIIPAAALLAV